MNSTLKVINAGFWIPLSLSLIVTLTATALKPLAANTNAASSRDIFVDPNGSDQGRGTKEYPFRTLDRARQFIRIMALTGT